jgi:MFS family permease
MTSLQRRLSLALGTTQTLAWATTYYIPATMTDVAAESLGTSHIVVLGAFSWSLLVAGGCAPRIGRFIDRNGGRAVLTTGSVITCAGLLVLAAATSVIVWYVAWTILGVGMAMALYDTPYSTIGRLLGTESRPAMVGVTMMVGFSSTIAWPLGTWLATDVGWRIGVVGYAATQVLVILPILLRFIPRAAPLPPLPPRQRATDGRTNIGISASAAFILLAVFFTSRAAISAVFSVHALVMLTGIGLTLGQALFVAGLVGPAQVGARVLEWRFTRNWHPLSSSLFGAALLPLGALVAALGGPATVFALCYGVSNGIITLTKGTVPLYVFGPHGYAILIGRLALPSLIIQAAAPTLLAPVIASVPGTWIMAGIAAVSAFACVCLVPFRRVAPSG